MNEESKLGRPRLFSVGYRACDIALLILAIGGPGLVIYDVFYKQIEMNYLFWGMMGISAVAVLALFRVKIAFAVLSIPFFVWATYSLLRCVFFPPEWVDLIDPNYILKWGLSICIEYILGMYFWSKFSNADFIDWVVDHVKR